jgi:chaperonin GroEL (HSP60 family)
MPILRVSNVWHWCVLLFIYNIYFIVFVQVLGGDVVSTFDTPDKVKLGTCKLIEPIMIGEDRLMKFSGVALGTCLHVCVCVITIYYHVYIVGEACTVVLRASTQQILDEAQRSLHDALCVLTTHLKESKTLFGGGMFCWDGVLLEVFINMFFV